MNALRSIFNDIANAIRIRHGSTSSKYAPSEMATAIMNIPGGGIDFIRVREAVKTMDGITRENPDVTELARAITEITRQPHRRGDAVTDEPEWTADSDKTAFVVKVDESVGLDFIVGCLWLKSDSTSATIDWGDGTTSTVTQSGAVRVKHDYEKAGLYLVQISDDITRFSPHLNEVNNTNFSSSNGRCPQGDWSTAAFDSYLSYAKANNNNIDKVYRAIQWGASINDASHSYNGCSGLTGAIPEWSINITRATMTYSNCSGLTGTVPAWNAKTTNALQTYSNCSGLTGAIPAWGVAITNASNTYYGCSGLTGEIPEWGAEITNAQLTYSYCSGLTGAIPAWGAKTTNAQQTYSNCSGLTGTIPAWGAKITNAYGTYSNCSGLTGTIPEWGVEITIAYGTYSGCSGLTGTIPAWSDKITSASLTYSGCSGLTGAIPAWSDKITAATSTYYNCSGLTGTIPEWGVEITNAQQTYQNCYRLTGTVPAWNAKTTNAQQTYSYCSGLTGAIPEWGAKITNAQETYRWCFGLTSIWDVEASDSDRMPARITSKSNCVNNTSQSLRAFFLTAWGGTRAF